MIAVWIAATIAWAQPEPSATHLAYDTVELTPIDEAWRRSLQGDQEGARRLAQQIANHDLAAATEATYLIGVTWQLEHHYDEAIAAFDEVAGLTPRHARTLDAIFRLAVARDAHGDAAAARRTLKRLPAWSTLPAHDQDKVRLLDAAAAMNHRPGKAAAKRVQRALEGSDEPAVSWFAAYARATLLKAAASASTDVSLAGSAKRAGRGLSLRSELLASADAQLQQIVALAEPAYILVGLHQLGLAYEDLASDLLATPVPRQLGDAEAERYRQLIRERASVIYTKARNHYTLGLDHAHQTGWHDPTVEQLDGAAARVTRTVDGLARP